MTARSTGDSLRRRLAIIAATVLVAGIASGASAQDSPVKTALEETLALYHFPSGSIVLEEGQAQLLRLYVCAVPFGGSTPDDLGLWRVFLPSLPFRLDGDPATFDDRCQPAPGADAIIRDQSVASVGEPVAASDGSLVAVQAVSPGYTVVQLRDGHKAGCGHRLRARSGIGGRGQR